ncbi:unnamed protein product [Protopolystoma xenopodis]|uniref:Ig-like domain-containing protein n=1 Tax=Protopolystoma xenopodis TaxID=117903 RepID=A0A3S5A7X3_9PLAT|nr:unnamed protein product [Protopolystoma xenopodis]
MRTQTSYAGPSSGEHPSIPASFRPLTSSAADAANAAYTDSATGTPKLAAVLLLIHQVRQSDAGHYQCEASLAGHRRRSVADYGVHINISIITGILSLCPRRRQPPILRFSSNDEDVRNIYTTFGLTSLSTFQFGGSTEVGSSESVASSSGVSSGALDHNDNTGFRTGIAGNGTILEEDGRETAEGGGTGGRRGIGGGKEGEEGVGIRRGKEEMRGTEGSVGVSGAAHEGEISAPRILQVAEGSNVTLFCLFEGAPIVSTRWYYSANVHGIQIDRLFGMSFCF